VPDLVTRLRLLPSRWAPVAEPPEAVILEVPRYRSPVLSPSHACRLAEGRCPRCATILVTAPTADAVSPWRHCNCCERRWRRSGCGWTEESLPGLYAPCEHGA